jgi:hypothetical protein
MQPPAPTTVTRLFLILAFGLATALASPAQTTPRFSASMANKATGPATLVQGANGDFYGTTGLDGVYGSGTVFEVTASGE